MDGKLSQDLILQSLPESFAQFVVNYHMNKLNTSLPELLNMLKTAESHIKKEKAPLLLVGKTSKKKSGFKGSKKALNPKGGKMKKKGKKVLGQGTYFHYDKAGHWKKNYKLYLTIVNASASDAPKGMYKIHTILSLSSFNSDSWVLDTVYDSHIYKSL